MPPLLELAAQPEPEPVPVAQYEPPAPVEQYEVQQPDGVMIEFGSAKRRTSFYNKIHRDR
jgi:hypothetical protein